jgi:hypothetical protein
MACRQWLAVNDFDNVAGQAIAMDADVLKLRHMLSESLTASPG